MMLLWLELEPDSEPIKGSLGTAQGERRAFEGWMEFAASLDALIAARQITPVGESDLRQARGLE